MAAGRCSAGHLAPAGRLAAATMLGDWSAGRQRHAARSSRVVLTRRTVPALASRKRKTAVAEPRRPAWQPASLQRSAAIIGRGCARSAASPWDTRRSARVHVDEFTHSTHTHVPLADHMHLDRNAVVIGDQLMVQLCVRGSDRAGPLTERDSDTGQVSEVFSH